VISVLIVDDQDLVREGLRMLLEAEPDLTVVGEAGDGGQALVQAQRLDPDVILMDVRMPHMNGIEATRQIKAHHPEIEVVVLSMHATRNYIIQVIQAGASAYLLKDSALEDLAAALVAVGKGGMYLSPAISTAAALKNEASGISEKNIADTQRLTKRELQVLQLIAEGHSTKEIATILEISIKTIETHRKQIMDKLDIRTIAGLTKYCIREGLTSL